MSDAAQGRVPREGTHSRRTATHSSPTSVNSTQRKSEMGQGAQTRRQHMTIPSLGECHPPAECAGGWQGRELSRRLACTAPTWRAAPLLLTQEPRRGQFLRFSQLGPRTLRLNPLLPVIQKVLGQPSPRQSCLPHVILDMQTVLGKGVCVSLWSPCIYCTLHFCNLYL